MTRAVPSDRDRIIDALTYVTVEDGAHHKQWIIDQMVRALTGCSMVERTAVDHRGRAYTYFTQGESDEYLAWVADYCDGEDGPETYSWDCGIAP